MLGTANGALIHESVHPCTALGRSFASATSRTRALASASAAGCRLNGAPCGAASMRRKKPEGWRAGCAPVRCQHTDVLSANRRSMLAQSEGRMPGDRATGGVLSFGDFSLHKQRKVTRSPQASGSFLFKREAESKELDSGLRRNDEQKKTCGTRVRSARNDVRFCPLMDRASTRSAQQPVIICASPWHPATLTGKQNHVCF